MSTHDTVAHGYPVYELRAVLRRHAVRRRRAGRAGGDHSAGAHGDGSREREQEHRPAVAALPGSAWNAMRHLRPSSEVLSRVRVPPATERAARYLDGRAGPGTDRGRP